MWFLYCNDLCKGSFFPAASKYRYQCRNARQNTNRILIQLHKIFQLLFILSGMLHAHFSSKCKIKWNRRWPYFQSTWCMKNKSAHSCMKIFFFPSVRFLSSDKRILKFRVSIKTCFKRVRNLNYKKNMPWKLAEIKSF